MTARISNLIQSRLFQDLLFWGVSFTLLLQLFSRTEELRQIDYIYTALFHLPLLAAVYLNALHLIPNALSKRKYVRYLGLTLALYGLTYLLYLVTFNYLADWLFPGYFFIAIYTPLEILGFFLLYVGTTSLIEFSKSWFREMEMQKKMERLQKEKSETELKALKAQINPHFLFNSLNHIYSLAYKRSPKTAPAILQLSDLLRYTLRQMDNATVPLADELDYLRKYVELHKNRTTRPEKVHFEVKGAANGLVIAPLLLIAFIENCFKHGSLEGPDETIDIGVTINAHRLVMNTRNSLSAATALPDTSGIGLQNARRRLNLLYPEKHKLEVAQKDTSFITKLEIDLS